MDGPHEGPSAPAPADPEAEYYRAIEEFFVSRRGDPLILSNADWVLIRTWRQADIPLRVVLRGIGDALDGHAHSFARRRKVASLRYCEGEVEAARERWYRALSLGREEGADLTAHLEGLAERLRSAEVPSQAAELCGRIAGELSDRAAAVDDAAELDAWLRQRERSLRDGLAEAEGREGLAEVVRQIDSDLEPYRGRMPAQVLAQVREESLTRRLLERHGLPRLSLFEVG
jgi:hypothetical protein